MARWSGRGSGIPVARGRRLGPLWVVIASIALLAVMFLGAVGCADVAEKGADATGTTTTSVSGVTSTSDSDGHDRRVCRRSAGESGHRGGRECRPQRGERGRQRIGPGCLRHSGLLGRGVWSHHVVRRHDRDEQPRSESRERRKPVPGGRDNRHAGDGGEAPGHRRRHRSDHRSGGLEGGQDAACLPPIS